MSEFGPVFWLVLNLISLLALSFYSMLEMACISFDKVRLQYYVTKGNNRIIWLNKLLQQPAKLFGTTLIGVNLALMIGSECAREFFASLDLPPELAPITQIILVVVLGDLAPMFAARRHPEHVVMLGVSIIWFSSKILAPFLYVIRVVSELLTKVISGKNTGHGAFLGRDELQHLLQVQEDHFPPQEESEEYNHIISNIFSIGAMLAKEVMRPLSTLVTVHAKCTTKELIEACKKGTQAFFPILKAQGDQVIGVVYPRDLLRVGDNRRVRDYAKQPWFIDSEMKVLDILKQFRINNESLALVINSDGDTIGYLSLDHILEYIFGSIEGKGGQVAQWVLIDRTLSGETTIGEVEDEFKIFLDVPKEVTLGDLSKEKLGDRPDNGDSFSLGSYEITIVEASYSEVKKIKFKTKVI